MKKNSDLKIPFSWEERRSILLESFLYIPGHYDGHSTWEKIPWSDEKIFGNQRAVHIEFCSGNGQWIGEKAKENPHINWVAVEKRFDRSRKIWLKRFRENLPNLFIVAGEGLTFAKHYAPLNSANEIYVNFPDPWPKFRHSKHRIIKLEFLNELTKIATAKAKATFTTDDSDYALQMLEVCSKERAFKPFLPSPHFTTSWENYGSSYFKDLWSTKGRNIHYLPYEINP